LAEANKTQNGFQKFEPDIPSSTLRMSGIKQIFQQVRGEGREEVTEPEAKQVLAEVLTIPERKSRRMNQRRKSAERMVSCCPEVLSPDILHKSDAGGVMIGVNDAKAVGQGFRKIIKSCKTKHPGAEIQGILVQEMVSGGIETILGLTNRPPFGPVVAFGLGGIFVEVMKDITFRIAPIDEAGAVEMLDEIKGLPC
jgi:acyl-CoA synthetase (NDP forming)